MTNKDPNYIFLEPGAFISYNNKNYLVLEKRPNNNVLLMEVEKESSDTESRYAIYPDYLMIVEDTKELVYIETIDNEFLNNVISIYKETSNKIGNVSLGSVVRFNDNFYYIYSDEGLSWGAYCLSDEQLENGINIQLNEREFYTTFKVARLIKNRMDIIPLDKLNKISQANIKNMKKEYVNNLKEYRTELIEIKETKEITENKEYINVPKEDFIPVEYYNSGNVIKRIKGLAEEDQNKIKSDDKYVIVTYEKSRKNNGYRVKCISVNGLNEGVISEITFICKKVDFCSFSEFNYMRLFKTVREIGSEVVPTINGITLNQKQLESAMNGLKLFRKCLEKRAMKQEEVNKFRNTEVKSEKEIFEEEAKRLEKLGL